MCAFERYTERATHINLSAQSLVCGQGEIAAPLVASACALNTKKHISCSRNRQTNYRPAIIKMFLTRIVVIEICKYNLRYSFWCEVLSRDATFGIPR
jgi:hypothetical protein